MREALHWVSGQRGSLPLLCHEKKRAKTNQSRLAIDSLAAVEILDGHRYFRW